MNKIIVADIFGKTPALLSLAKKIKVDTVIDPYEGKMIAFDDEAHAYQNFTDNVGFDVYADKLLSIVKASSDEISLIGFSVGASAIWQLSELASVEVTKRVQYAIGFYGSQIRHRTELSLNFDIQLVLPKTEQHFDVLALKHLLTHKPRVTAIQVEYLHGFMNFYSKNFNQAGYDDYVAILQSELSSSNLSSSNQGTKLIKES